MLRSLSPLLLAWLVVVASTPARADSPPRTTITFKQVGALAIQADLYAPSKPGPRPTVLWVHGGALILGDRLGIPGTLRDLLLAEGYAICSIDYRLAPATKIAGIHEDIVDAYAWLRREGASRFSIDPDRIAVLGGSAGGYLTLSAGYLFNPRPAALVSFWGYGDIAGPWYSQPDAFYRTKPLVPRDVAHRATADGMVTTSRGNSDRYKFYLYCRQNGLWPLHVTGVDPHRFPQTYDAWCPLRNVTKDYPPTLLIHGDKDTDVPFEQSVLMDAALTRADVPHQFLPLPGVGHGLGGVEDARVDAVYQTVLSFLRRHLTGD